MMTINHTELCERLRDGPARVGVMRYAADLIESQAARIQQQALEYVSLFDQCSQQLARIAELEKERDALKADAARYRWLRGFGKDGVNLKPPCEHVYTLLYSHPVGVIPASRVIAGDELDRAIDAALQAEKEAR